MQTGDKQIRQARFWRKFLRLTRGRIPVLRALEVARQEESDPAFGDVLARMKSNLDSGLTLSEAAARHADVFPLSVVELLRSAENTGAWDEILEEIAGGLEDGTFA